MKTVTTRSPSDILYQHICEVVTNKKTGKTKEVTLEFRLRSDPPGIVPWIVPSPDGKVPPPNEHNYAEFLELVVHPKSAAAMADAIEDGTFSEKAQYDAAVQSWMNSMGEKDYMTMAASLYKLTQEVERLELLVEEAQDDEDEPEEASPLED